MDVVSDITSTTILMIKQCDNIIACHNPITIGEDNNALRWHCKNCKQTGIIRKDWRGVNFNREYSKIYKKEILQPHEPLFYKYYPHYMRS